MEALVQLATGALLICLAYMLELLAPLINMPSLRYASIASGAIGALVLLARLSIWGRKMLREKPWAETSRDLSLSEYMLYGVTGYVQGEESVWRTKKMKAFAGFPHVIHKICPTCNKPIHMDSRFCEFCGAEVRRRTDIGLRLQSMTPAFATCDNVSEDLQQVYSDDGKVLGLASGRADPLGDVLKVTHPDGSVFECPITRLLFIPVSSVPGEVKGYMLMMPDWFHRANEVLALANVMRGSLTGLLDQLRSGRISEKEFTNAYLALSSRAMSKENVSRIPQLEANLTAQKAKVVSELRAIIDEDIKNVLGYELRTIDSLLAQITSSREAAKRFTAQISAGSYSQKIKTMVSEAPSF